ncbi:MAG: Hsp20/alpha crystallin family protein [Candidatus Aenigmatarchaeota archaeon]
MPIWEEDIFEELERMRRRIHELMRKMWEPIEEEFIAFRSFPVDLRETDEEIIAKADLPGFNKDEISVKATENTLEITAQHKEKKIEKGEGIYKAEKKFGVLKRFLTLPAKVDYSKAEAKFENGVLTVKLPKKEKKKVGKEIKIK